MYHSTVTAPTQSSILEALNPRKREAVEHIDGPLLILAGPGSGKTRVIAHRIAYLIREKDVRPRRVLAVTFTNKAAREMRDRVFTLVGEDLGRDITLGTFHAVCSRMLRIDGETIGVPRTFTIYDDSDQIAAVKRALEDQGVDPRRIAPRAVLSAISRAKSELQGPREFAAIVADYFQEVTSRVFLRYQDLLEQHDALNFEHDFPDARLVVLDQNYRSTQTILDSAHSVIALNKQRKEKNLWTENGAGGPI